MVWAVETIPFGGLVSFLSDYGDHWLDGVAAGMTGDQAYAAIHQEQEAYAVEEMTDKAVGDPCGDG